MKTIIFLTGRADKVVMKLTIMSSLFLAAGGLTGCVTTSCGELYFGLFDTDTQECGEFEPVYTYTEIVLPETETYVGQDFYSYQDLNPKGDLLAMDLYKMLERAPYNERLPLSLYEVKVDEKGLGKAAAELGKEFSLTQDISAASNNQTLIYKDKNDNTSLKGDLQTGTLTYTNIDLNLATPMPGKDLNNINKDQLLKLAQQKFEKLLPNQISQSYYYKYETIFKKNTTDKVTRVRVYINRMVDGVATLGSTGKSYIEFNADTKIIKIELQFKEFKNEEERKAYNIPAGFIQSELFHRLKTDGISITEYNIDFAGFGYKLEEEEGKAPLLAPYYVFIVKPKDGVTGATFSYYFKGYELAKVKKTKDTQQTS